MSLHGVFQCFRTHCGKKSSLNPRSKNYFEFSQLSWYTEYEREQIMGTEAEVRKQLDYVVYYLSLIKKPLICISFIPG